MSAHKQHCADIVHGPPLSSFVCSPFYWAVLQFDRFFPAHILLLVITFVAENRIGEKKLHPEFEMFFPSFLILFSYFFVRLSNTPNSLILPWKKKSERNSLVNAFYNECNMKQRERERALLQLTYISDTKYNMLTKIHFVCLCAKFTFVHFKLTYTLINPFRFCWRHTHTHTTGQSILMSKNNIKIVWKWSSTKQN